jgi:hypothetical protein
VRKTLVVAACGVALAASTANSGVAADRWRTANLDSDPAPERVIARQLCESLDGNVILPQPTCGEGQLSRRRIEIEDRCNGQPVQHVISSAQDDVSRLRVKEADGATAQPEVFFDLRSGATGRAGDIRVVRLDDVAGGCSTARTLFRYPSRATQGRIPRRRGAAGRDSFSVSLRELRKRYGGREAQVIETYVDRDDAFCCPSFRRTSRYRFARSRDAYVRYATRVKRIKAPGKRP